MIAFAQALWPNYQSSHHFDKGEELIVIYTRSPLWFRARYDLDGRILSRVLTIVSPVLYTTELSRYPSKIAKLSQTNPNCALICSSYLLLFNWCLRFERECIPTSLHRIRHVVRIVWPQWHVHYNKSMNFQKPTDGKNKIVYSKRSYLNKPRIIWLPPIGVAYRTNREFKIIQVSPHPSVYDKVLLQPANTGSWAALPWNL